MMITKEDCWQKLKRRKMLWSSRTNDGFPPLGLNCSDTLWSRHLQENIYSIHNHDIMIVTSNFSIIDHFSSDLLTNCTTGGSIPPWPVLSPSITETSKDHRVHKKQAANGKHDQDVLEKCHHCFFSLLVNVESTSSQQEVRPWQGDSQQWQNPPWAPLSQPPDLQLPTSCIYIICIILIHHIGRF